MTSLARLRLAVLISGRGSNLQALIDATRLADFPAEISLVISNEPEALGLERAARAGIRALVIPHKRFPNKGAFESAVDQALREARADYVCLAGFMRLLSPEFCEQWKGSLINIHPSLLPAFRGLHTHERALAAGVKFHGATVHEVRAEVDEGPIIAQAVVPVLPDDTVAALSTRVLDAEHQLFPHAIRLLAAARAGKESQKAGQAGSGQSTPRASLPAYLINPTE